MMRPLTPVEIVWLKEAALGPFSFLVDGERHTASAEWEVCASTYDLILRNGWLTEAL